ncbi:MAG: hypothetical protein ACYC3S_13250 [Chloroflexota bacterium]
MVSNTAKQSQSVAEMLNAAAEQVGPNRVAAVMVAAVLQYILRMLRETWEAEPLSPVLQEAIAEEVRRMAALVAPEQEADRILAQATALVTEMAVGRR